MMAWMVMFVMVVDPAFTHSLSIFNVCNLKSTPFSTYLNAPGVLFLKTLVLTMYLSSAWRKIQYRFYDGVVLTEGSRFLLNKSGRKFPDHPNRLTKYLMNAVISNFPVGLARLTIVAEIAIFVLLFLGGTYAYVGCCIGVFLHLGMTLLFPITLSFFTAMMFSSYVLWLIP
jgi:hypothetical protein